MPNYIIEVVFVVIAAFTYGAFHHLDAISVRPCLMQYVMAYLFTMASALSIVFPFLTYRVYKNNEKEQTNNGIGFKSNEKEDNPNNQIKS